MKLIILKENLKKGLSVVDKITSKSVTLPILNNILMEASGNFLCLSATDLEMGINYWTLAKIEEEGRITVPVKLFSPFISSLSEKTITIKSDNKMIYLTTKNNKANIKGLDPNEFPIIPEIKSNDFIEIDSSSLCNGISSVVNFCASSQIRPELSGVYFLFQKDKLNIVATDSFRLAEKIVYYKNSIVSGNLPNKEYSFILPQKTARELIGAFSEEKNKIRIYFSPNQISFESLFPETSNPHIRLISRLVEGEYPNYQEIIPKKYETQAVLPKNELLNQIKSASLFSGKINEIEIKLNPKKQRVNFFSQNQEYGKQESYIYGKIEGKEVSVSFNFRFLIDGISNITTKNIFLGLNGKEGPAILKPIGESDYIYIVMPIKPN